MSRKLHAPSDATGGLAVGLSLCGWPASDLTADVRRVTCKLCERELERRRREGPARVGWEEAVYALAHLFAGPRIEAYPRLTPDLYRNMRCRHGKAGKPHCYCEHCTIDAANKTAKDEWDAEQTLRPHRHYERDFGSTRAALELLLRWRQDGPAARSSLGSLASRLSETTRLGTEVQTTRRPDRDSIETRRVVQAADVEAACKWAYGEEQERRGLSQGVCVAILLDSVDASGQGVEWWAEQTGLSERAVKSLVTHGLRQVTVWLAAEDYMPRPRARAGLDGAIDRRLRETGRAA